MKLGEYIKNYRATNSLTMEEFAKRANTSKAYISMIEKNKNSTTGRPIVPSMATYKSIANATGITLQQLLEMLDGNQRVDLKNIPVNRTTVEAELLEAFTSLEQDQQEKLVDFAQYLLSVQNKKSNGKG